MKKNLIDYNIRTIPDYPKKGINFYDLNSLFASDLWNPLISEINEEINSLHPTHIVGIESRGFVFGAALAQEANVPFCMVRKKGSKYPGNLLEESYELEYGEDTLVLQEGILGHTSRVLIADDLVATGGSIIATSNLIRKTGARVEGVVTIINLKKLNTAEFNSYNSWSAFEIYSN